MDIRCIKCGISGELFFYNSSREKTGKDYYCKECRNEVTKESATRVTSAGNCKVCGKKREGRSKVYCNEHRQHYTDIERRTAAERVNNNARTDIPNRSSRNREDLYY